MAAERGIAVEVASAGMSAEVGEGMYPDSAACAARHGLDGSAHVARQIADADVASADIIVALAGTTQAEATWRLHLAARRLGVTPKILYRPVPNPWGMSPRFHDGTYEEISAICAALLDNAQR